MIVITHTTVDRFIDDLDLVTYAKTIRSLGRLMDFGPHLSEPDAKKIEKGLFELRIRADVQVRLFYGFRKDKIFVVHAIVKKTAKIPPKDIVLALRRLAALA
jgi:phage-related protein